MLDHYPALIGGRDQLIMRCLSNVGRDTRWRARLVRGREAMTEG